MTMAAARPRFRLFPILLACFIGPAAVAEPNAPSTQPANGPNFVVTDMRVLDTGARPYLFAETTTSYAELRPALKKLFADLHQTMLDGHIRPAGTPILVYRGAAKDMNHPFQLQVGIPVPEGTKDTGDFHVRTLEPFHSATVIFSGPMQEMRTAYEQDFQQVFQAGLEPTGEIREYYLFREAAESPNNVIMLQIGVK